MANLFDGLQERLFDTTTTVFGYDALWTPLNGGAEQSGRVHLREPNDKEILQRQDYNPEDPVMEYREGVFPGLYESVRNKQVETVTVNGILYDARHAEKLHDGKTYKVYLLKAD